MLQPVEISTLLKDRRLPVIERATGVHYNTLQNIRDRPSECNPTYRVLKALSDYFEQGAVTDDIQ